MGIRIVNTIRITRPRATSALPVSIQSTPDIRDDFSHLLKNISRHGKYPSRHWSDMDGTDMKTFCKIVNNLISSNPDSVISGQNNDTAPGALFENLESGFFKVDGKQYSVFITHQTSPKTGDLYYHEISILQQEDRDPLDPRGSRKVSLMTADSSFARRIQFVQSDQNDADFWWQMKKIWSYFKKHNGQVNFSSGD